MPEKRYHIHLICAEDNQTKILDGLSIFMENRAFLTRNLLEDSPKAVAYSRNCIDRCDFIMVLVGDSYGKLTNTGVSQLHLSYIYADTKAKPMMIMLKLQSNSSQCPRQLTELIHIVEGQHSDSIYYYDDDVKMDEYIEPAYRKFLAEHLIINDKSLGWLKANNKKTDVLSDLKTINYTPDLNTEKKPKNKLEIFDHDVKASFQIDFITQAFQDGNLSEVALKATLTWLQVLKAIDKLPAPISQTSFQRVITELVQNKALQLVQIKNPKVHAVSRTSVMEADLDWIHSQLINSGWLIQISKNSASKLRSSYEVLELTHKGQLASRSL